MRLVEQRGDRHQCDLPRRGWPWNRNPLCKIGNVIQCEICHSKWVWDYSYAHDEFPGWNPVYDKSNLPYREFKI
jgi:hypothetical protein